MKRATVLLLLMIFLCDGQLLPGSFISLTPTGNTRWWALDAVAVPLSWTYAPVITDAGRCEAITGWQSCIAVACTFFPNSSWSTEVYAPVEQPTQTTFYRFVFSFYFLSQSWSIRSVVAYDPSGNSLSCLASVPAAVYCQNNACSPPIAINCESVNGVTPSWQVGAYYYTPPPPPTTSSLPKLHARSGAARLAASLVIGLLIGIIVGVGSAYGVQRWCSTRGE